MREQITLGRTQNVRFTPAQYDTLTELARRQGLTVSALIRQARIQRFALPTDVTDTHEMLECTPDADVTPAAEASS